MLLRDVIGVARCERIVYVDHVLGIGQELFEAVRQIGAEGIVSKRRGSLYRGGESLEWLKTKCFETGVFAITDSARGKTMGWHPTRTPGSSLRRFRVWVTVWSGALAVVWAALAIWRTVAYGSAQFAIVLAFGLFNLVVVSRVVFPGKRTA